MKQLLKNIDARIITAMSGAAAQQLIASEDNIALVLLDIEMPDIDGFEVSQRMQQEERMRAIPIIFITSHHKNFHIDRAYAAGAVDYLTKPVNESMLISKVRVFLDLWRLRAGLEQEIEQRKLIEKKIEHLADHDPLTGLFNRRGLYEQLDRLINLAGRYKFSSAVIYIDLDGFKSVNDGFGHDAGDALLKQVSKNYEKLVRRSDTVARVGGDEFVILLYNIGGADPLFTKIERIIEASSKPAEHDGRYISVSASVGVSLYPDHGSDPETLLKHADQAMYQAKKEGKNTYRFFSEEINQLAARKRELQKNLRRALSENEFSAYYQPIVEVESCLVRSVEALMRWTSPEIGSVPPDEFIPAAESVGVISELGCWILSEAIGNGADWYQRYGLNLRVAVNASTLQFKNKLLFKSLKQQLERHNWTPDLLELEITEGLLLDNSNNVLNYLNDIRDLGVRLSVDDFGTGYSALSYLKKFPLNTIKIDRSFVKGLPDDKEDRILVSAIIAMAHGLGLEVIAEGVENAEQRAYLKDLNCDFAQGYYFGKPMTKSDFEEYLVDQIGR